MQRMSAVPRRDAADESETDGPSQHADVLQVLQGLDERKSDLIKKMRNSFENFLKGIEELRSFRPTTLPVAALAALLGKQQRISTKSTPESA